MKTPGGTASVTKGFETVALHSLLNQREGGACRAACTRCSRASCRGCARPARWSTSRPSGPGSSAGTRPSTGACRRARCRGSAGASSVVTEELAGGFPAYVITPRGVDADAHACSTCTAAASWRRSARSRSGTPPGWPTRSAPASCCPTTRSPPSTPGATATTPLADLAARWAAEPGGIVLAGDSSGGGYALAVALALRDRGAPAADATSLLHSPWVDLTTSTPETPAFDDVDPWLFIGKLRRVRRLVGRLPRGPRPPRGQPRAGRPGGPAAGADVLRHPRPAGARLPAAAPPRRRGRLGPDRRRGAGPDPRLPAAAVPPRGAARRSARRWSSCA